MLQFLAVLVPQWVGDVPTAVITGANVCQEGIPMVVVRAENGGQSWQKSFHVFSSVTSPAGAVTSK